MADGTPRRLDALRAGDAIVAARADGMTVDGVIAKLVERLG